MICSMSDETVTSLREGHAACPFVAFEDDRDHRAETPDYRHRCFASLDPEPRALPHQERFCLSAAFAACPIFLDWARAEAAGVVNKSAATAPLATARPSSSATPTPAPVPTTGAAALLASTARTTPAESIGRTPRAADPGSGLWGFEGAPKRTIAPVSAARVATSSPPAVSMARRLPSRPDWENAPHLENYPRLRSRDERANNQPLLLAALAITVLMVGLIVMPLLNGSGGGGGNGGAGPTGGASGASAVVLATETPTPTIEATPTFQIYTVQPGQNITIIATKFGITPDLLLAANPQIKNPNNIMVGQKLKIPWTTWIPPESPTPTNAPILTAPPSASASPSPH
jgi:LysM repeat protein